jgi:RNA polymerase sigma factor (sigma-70 family)
MEPLSVSAARAGGISLLRMQSDERLAELASAGREEAFETLVRRYRRSLVRSCRRVLPDDRAEDAVQQALLDAHQALARTGPPRSFRPWIHRIAVNAALRQLSHDGDTVPLAEELDGQESPEQAHERRERLGRVVAAIGALPRRQRRALVLRELEGRSHEEIARELGLSGGAVRQLIHRARNSVRAGASALIPPALVVRMLGAGGATATRLAEAGAGADGAGIAAKVAVAAIVAGGVAGGVTLDRDGVDRSGSAEAAQSRGSNGSGGSTPMALGVGSGEGGPGPSSSSGPGSGGSSGPSGNSCPGSNSGPSGSSGTGGGDDGSGSSGSRQESSGSSGSGSGDGSDGELEDDAEIVVEEDSSGSGSSGSGISGSGSSGSDSLSSGSGSGSSGSGSSGSG